MEKYSKIIEGKKMELYEDKEYLYENIEKKNIEKVYYNFL